MLEEELRQLGFGGLELKFLVRGDFEAMGLLRGL